MKPRVILTIGDINGIGPEIILKSLKTLSGTSNYKLAVASAPGVLQFYSRLLGIKLPPHELISVSDKEPQIQPGKISKLSGRISGLAIKRAVELCLERKFDAVVTAPISKEALNLGGFHYDGHTEMLTDLAGAKQTAMIMVHKKIIIGFASTHPPLREVARMLTRKLLQEKIEVCHDSLVKDFNLKVPRIAVLSLNPHAGDGGLIGDEEIRVVKPALNHLRKKLKRAVIQGPFPSDSYFGNKTYKHFNMTFALYHDQGFIPFKMLAGNYGVNFTAGLPFIRTSPDHGTAFDIAGKNLADPASMLEAIKTAVRFFARRRS